MGLLPGERYLHTLNRRRKFLEQHLEQLEQRGAQTGARDWIRAEVAALAWAVRIGEAEIARDKARAEILDGAMVVSGLRR